MSTRDRVKQGTRSAGHAFRGSPVLATCLHNAVDFVVPRLCLLCERPCHHASRWLCADCETVLHATHVKRNACPRCSQNRDLHTCTCDLVWDYPFDRIFAFFDFDDRIKVLAHEFKYRGKKRLAYDLGRLVGAWMPPEITVDVANVTAVPLHFLRRMSRGYNQAEWFARGIAVGLGRPDAWHNGLLRRTRHTRTQTKLDKAQRAQNLANAFEVPPTARALIAGKRLLLVDDVVTTGATTGACARALVAAGAASVSVVSLARD